MTDTLAKTKIGRYIAVVSHLKHFLRASRLGQRWRERSYQFSNRLSSAVKARWPSTFAARR